MTPLEIIDEWLKGCSHATKNRPEECHECTRSLIYALQLSLLGAKVIAIATLTYKDGDVEMHRRIPVVDDGVNLLGRTLPDQ